MLPRLGTHAACRRLLAPIAAVLALALVGTVSAAVPVQAQEEPISETVTVTGHGWGHGRGMGQWGAFGYATGRSGGPWTYRQILDHFYGETVVGSIENPLAAVTLLGRRGQPLTVMRGNGVEVGGLPGPSTAARATLRPDGKYDVELGASCGGPWSEPVVVDGPVRMRAPNTTGQVDDVLQLCLLGATVGYRGELVAMDRAFDGGDAGLAQTVNLVRVDDLLRSVVPNQVPPVWGTTDEGRGMQAVKAQAVAARGFAAAGDGRWHDLHSGLGADFSTCDTTSCQRYDGVASEDPITDEAVRTTTGEVRMRNGSVVRTEFTASSGGWTVPGTFTGVPDLGDAVPSNPHHRWTTLLDRSAIETKYGLGRLIAMQVLERNGLGEDGGRVLRLRLVGTGTEVEVTGAQFRNDFGLRSDWFTLSGVSPRPPVEPRPINLACPAGEVPDRGYADVTAGNVHALAIDCVTWWEVAEGSGFARFDPSGSVTRAQMASFLLRLIEAAGGEVPPSSPDAFVDDDGSVHEDAINALAELGIVRGEGVGRFAPSEAVGRAQVASLVGRALEHLGVALPADPTDAFADDTGSVHEPQLNALAAEGIVSGVSAGRVQPSAPTRRDQMASLLARTLDLIVERTDTTTP